MERGARGRKIRSDQGWQGRAGQDRAREMGIGEIGIEQIVMIHIIRQSKQNSRTSVGSA
jgi:hypothetical protein